MKDIQKYNPVFKYFDQAVVISDINGVVYFFNKKAEEIYEYTSEEIVGKNMYDEMPALNLEKREMSEIRKLHGAGESFSSEYKVSLRSGREIIIYATVSPIFNDNGKVEGLIAISNDITERKKRESLLQLLNDSTKDLSADLVWDKMLDNIGNLIVPKFADWFALYLYNEENEDLDVVLLKHSDPKKVKYAYEMSKKYPPSIRNNYGAGQVFVSKQKQLVTNLSEDLINTIAQDEEHREILLNLDIKSFLLLPMMVKDKCIGVISLINTKESSLHFTGADIEIMEELVRRISFNIENAKLYQQSKQELSRRKQAEIALMQMFETLPQIAWTNYADGEVDYFNKRWFDFTGLNHEESYGLHWTQAFHPDDIVYLFSEWEEYIKNQGIVFEKKVRIRNKKGVYKWFLNRTVPLVIDNEKPIKWIGTITNIDEQVNEERKKDEFLSIASHEIKTPLSSAKAYLDFVLMLDSEYSENTGLYLNKVRQQLNVLQKLVVDFLELSRIQTGKVEYRFNEIDIDELISNSIQNFTYLNHKNLRYSNRINKLIAGDKDRLEQVLNNLLSNAVKYSPPTDEVFIYTKELSDKVQIVVEDKGKGIGKDDLEKIFEKFYKVDDNENVTGMGIGLYITKEIINFHKGRIWAESEEGKGTKFIVELPEGNDK